MGKHPTISNKAIECSKSITIFYDDDDDHPSIDAFVHDIQAVQHASGTTYALFTDGSFRIGDLPIEHILESEHSRRRYGTAYTQPIPVLCLSACFQPIIGSSAYTTETMALALAVRISTILPPNQSLNPISSDYHSHC